MKNWYGNNNGAINLTFSGIMTSKFKCWSRSDSHHWSSSGYWLIVVWTVLDEETRCDNDNGDIVVASLQQRLLRTGTAACHGLPTQLSFRQECWGVLGRTSRDSRRLSSIPHLPDRLHSHISFLSTRLSSSTFYTTKQPDEDCMDANFPAHPFQKSQINIVLSATHWPWVQYSPILKRPDGELNCWTRVFGNFE